MKLKTKLAIFLVMAAFLGMYSFEAVSAFSAMALPEAAIAVASVAAFSGLLYWLGYVSNSGGWNRLPFLIGAVFLVIHVFAVRATEPGNPYFAFMIWSLLNFGPAFVLGVQFGEWNYEKRSRNGVAHA